MPAEEKNRAESEQNNARPGLVNSAGPLSLSHRQKDNFACAHCSFLRALSFFSFLRALSFFVPTHHIPFGVTGSYRLFALLEYSLILSLPSWKVK